MNNIENEINELITAINSLPNIKRLHELEKIIDNNQAILEKFDELKETQKRIVNSKHYGLFNQAKLDEERLKEIKKDMSDIPFLEEYLELLEEAYLMISNISKLIEGELNNHI